MIKKLITSLISIFIATGIAYGATIYTTNTTDTIGTFRTNVNDSLTNLNTAISSISTFAYPFTTTSYGNSTTTIMGFVGGFLSSASSTINSSLYLPNLSAGLTYIGTSGLLNSTATTTSTCSGTVSCSTFTILGSSPVTITGVGLTSYDAFTHPSAGVSATTSSMIFTNASSTFTGNLNITGNSTTTNATSTTNYSSGTISGLDKTYGYLGVASPLKTLPFRTATTTGWQASTTNTAYSPDWLAPFSGTIRNAICTPIVNGSTGSFIGVNVTINGSSVTPSYFVASSTVGTITFTGNNTFIKGQVVIINFGTTTSATATSVLCSLGVTETP